MRIAVTGSTGFVGGHLARALAAAMHEVVLVARGRDRRDTSIRDLPGVTPALVGISDSASLEEAFANCDAVAHCAGINREKGTQTYKAVHVQGTRNVMEAARRAGVKKIVLVSFLRARPGCGSGYHESKYAAEEIIRQSGLDYTILKEGITYGRGDHMLDHLNWALRHLPVWTHSLLARVWEAAMEVPLASRAQVRMVDEGLSEPAPSTPWVPEDLAPRTRFTPEAVRQGLPA